MEHKTQWDVVVIGGGPAGMMAAGRAAERGHRVLVLERNPALGKKLLITGGGRCNVTNNTIDVRIMLAKYIENSKYLFSAFTQHGVEETLKFFHDWGMKTKEEEEGRVFPVSNSAASVLDVLVRYMKKGGVTVWTKAEVKEVAFDSCAEEALITLADASVVRARSCVVATGGTSRPDTGSTGDGFQLLKKIGHTIIESNVALVPIALKDLWVKKAAGVILRDIKLTSYKNNVLQKVYKGKLLFTHFGVSGPTVLNMSKEIGDLLRDTEGSEYLEARKKKISASERNVTIILDLFPTLDGGALRERIQAILIGQSNKKIKNVLSPMIPPAFVTSVLELAHIDPETPNHSVRSADRKKLVALMKSIPLHVSGLLGKNKAVISSGGVKLNEVNFKIMQSRIAPWLYLAGDVLNIDRPSGGYSLQLCWTTGYIAGNSC